MRKLSITSVLALVLVLVVATSAFAYTLNSDGTGFVGKGEIQLALGLNNAQIQSTPVSFTYVNESVTEVSWECTNTRNENIQERERTTTITTTGVVSSLARVKNQITGYNLLGFTSTEENSSSEGPAVNSCPTNWVLSSPAGDPAVISSSGGLYANGVLLP